MVTLTEKHAFAAMVLFLQLYYKQTNSDDVATILADLSLLQDGVTQDPAAWDDWMSCVAQVVDAARSAGSWEQFEQRNLHWYNEGADNTGR